MLEFITAPQNIPFSVALAVMFGIAILEGITALFGAALSGLLETLIPGVEFNADLSDVEVQSPNALSRLLGWLRIGQVPVLILFVIFLTSFGLIGLGLQSLSHTITGSLLPYYIMSIPAVFLSMPSVRVLGGAIGHIMPKDETDAVSPETFIGRIATITLGTAKKGSPAEAKIKDHLGTTHYIMVEPDSEGDEFNVNTPLLIISREGHIFKTIKNENSNLVD